MRRDSTGLKLGIAFGCLIALLIGVGWLGLSRMGQINATANRLFDERSQKLDAARQAATYFISNNRIVIRLFLMGPNDKKETAALVAQLKGNTLKGSAAWKQIEAEPATDAEKELIGEINLAGGPAYESLPKAVSLLVDQGKADDAKKMIVDETLPLLNKYRDSWSPYLDYEENQLNLARMQTRTSYVSVRRLSVTLIFLAIGLAVAIAVFVTRRLTREMEIREGSQFAIRNLNEGLERKVAERTEELARTVETLKEEVTGRTSQEAGLRRLAAIVEYSDDAIIAASLDGTITDWNPGAERMLGFSRSEIIGNPISLITPQELHKEPLECQARLLKGESVVRLESFRRKKRRKTDPTWPLLFPHSRIKAAGWSGAPPSCGT